MRKKRILIIDDEASFTRLLALNLGCTGKYLVRAENWAPKAFAVARQFRPDLILLDVMMPQMDGGEIASELQNTVSFKEVPLVFLTAAVKRDEVHSRKGLIGGFPYLAKPVNLDELIGCIDKTLKKQTGTERGLKQARAPAFGVVPNDAIVSKRSLMR